MESKTKNSGVEFEHSVGAFLLKEHGYKRYYIHKKVPSADNDEGIKVDIIAEKDSIRGNKLRSIVRNCCVACVLLALVGISLLLLLDDMFYGYVLVSSSAIIEAVTIYLYFLVTKYSKEHAWVECKDWTKPVPHKEVNKMVNEFEAYKRTKNTDFDFTAKYFVVSHEFANNALDHAQRSGVLCYMNKNGIFVKADNWINAEDLN